MDLVEKGRGVVDSGWKPNSGGLADLALVTSLNIPLYIGVERGPPEAVEKDAARGVEALVAELVMGIANERVPNGGAGVELMSAVVLLSPETSSGDEETVRSANETGQRVGG